MKLDRTTRKWILVLVAISLAMVWFMQRLELIPQFFTSVISFFSPLLLGVLIAFVVNLPLRWIENGIFGREWKKWNSFRTNVKRPLSLLLAYLIIAAVIAAMVSMVIPDLVSTTVSFSQRLPGAIQDLSRKLQEVNTSDIPLLEYFAGSNFTLDNLINKGINWLNNTMSEVAGSLISLIGNIVNGFFNFSIGFVFSIYFLLQKENLGRQAKQVAYAVFSEDFVDRFVKLSGLVNTMFSKFIGGQGIEAFILAFLVFVGMQILRIPYPLTISVLVLIGALIPIFGAFIAGTLGAILVAVQSPIQAVIFVAMLITIQTVEGNFIYPRVVGKSVGLPSMWVLFAVTFGSKLFGFFGLLLSVPAFSVIYVLVRAWSLNRVEEKGVAQEKLKVATYEDAYAQKQREDMVSLPLSPSDAIRVEDYVETNIVSDTLESNAAEFNNGEAYVRESAVQKKSLVDRIMGNDYSDMEETAEDIFEDDDESELATPSDMAENSARSGGDSIASMSAGEHAMPDTHSSSQAYELPHPPTRVQADKKRYREDADEENESGHVRKSKIMFDLDRLEKELQKESEEAREIRQRAWNLKNRKHGSGESK